ncbi:winged helix-turn-helix domain-containing protein [Bradyrhizobium liaoningense]|nr:winged helix-turn-helix domain-containing protein [Bradyrhizobium liaoningense]MBR1167505.1 winged helix-turn-helix domain-containing protein [Bradyrhizobium liaoningense]
MVMVSDQARGGISFGPFTFVPGERLLTKEGVPVELGARALDILIALLSRPNEVISKKDLMARVWPDVRVEEGSLRFHMASLRKALGDGRNGARYITTLAGQGYCFVAPVSRAPGAPDLPRATETIPYANLPARLNRMVGRDADVVQLAKQLIASRIVTIVGAGGVGKTTVAIAVAHHLKEVFANSILFVDLGMLNDPKLAPTAVASMLGQSVQSDDATPSLVAFLRSRRILLILDTCEHLVDAVAPLAANIIEAAPQVHILATSREALRIESEQIYRLDALACPPDNPAVSAAELGKFPATQLFVERALASGARFDLGEAEAAIVADICRKLDGVALSIELAARRVESHGLQQTAKLLDQHLAWLWQGSRSAPPRQRTLRATLEWSHGLLSELERVVLRRLAVFVGPFTLDAALDVVTCTKLDRSEVFDAIDNLVAKSMLVSRPIGAMMRYRLLDTTRAYVLGASQDPAEEADLAARHATYYRRWLEQTGNEWENLPTGAQRAPYFAGLNNVRAALEWCFRENGNRSIGVDLAAAATPVFLAMSLLVECQRWSELALLTLVDQRRGGQEEMHLQAGLGISLLFTQGNSDRVHAALTRSLSIAEDGGDAFHISAMLSMLHLYHLRNGDYRLALECAERSSSLASTHDDAMLRTLANALLGISRHLVGDLPGARGALEAALENEASSALAGAVYFGFDHLSLARASLATTLWLQGYPVQACELALEAIHRAEGMKHPVSLVIALTALITLLWLDELDAAEHHLSWFVARAETQYFAPYVDVGHGLQAELAIRRGDVEAVQQLISCLDRLHTAHYERFTVRFSLMIARSFAATGRLTEGITLVDNTIRLVQSKGGIPYTPELLRLKGSILLKMPKPRIKEAETCFMQSLEFSRAQGLRAWELRTATEFAAHWANQGRVEDARTLLRPVFEQFTEGFDAPDLQTAKSLLTALG